MPVRFTKRGAFLIHRDEATRKWQSISGIAISWLTQYVTADPGVTVSDVFDAVGSSQELSRFLTEYTGCDVGELHAMDRTPRGELLVPPGAKKVDGRWDLMEGVPAELLRIDPAVDLYIDPDTGDHCHKLRFMSFVTSYASTIRGTSLGQTAMDHFGDICQLHIRIETEAYIDRGNYDDETEDEEDESAGDPLSTAIVDVTLLDFLSTLYGMFGKPKYSNHDAKTLEEFDRIVDLFNAEDENDEWWKGNEDETP